jgi:hypothetical protein
VLRPLLGCHEDAQQDWAVVAVPGNLVALLADCDETHSTQATRAACST